MKRGTGDRIPVTEAMREELKGWQSKTGFGIIALFRQIEFHQLFERRKDFTAAAFQNVTRGHTKTVSASAYQNLLKAYEQLDPDSYHKPHGVSRQKRRVPFTEELRQELMEVFGNPAAGRNALLRRYGAPRDLRPETLGRILSGETQTIQKHHVDFLRRVAKAHQAPDS